jgi:hypothetical protein
LLNNNNIKLLPMVHITFATSEEKKIRFKVLCIEHGDKMSDVLRDAVDEYITSKRKRNIVKS